MPEMNRLRGIVGAVDALTRASSSRSARSAARRQRRRLAGEIAAYRTPAERLELDLILGRHTAEETQEIEEILRHQDAHRAFAQRTQSSVGVRI
jgi:hypothetical protein